MKVEYGKLQMRIVRVLDFQRNPVMSDDGVDYLHTKFTINAVGMVNSQVDRSAPINTGLGMSHKRGADGEPFSVIPVVEPQTNPINTDIAIRHWMSVPRRTLIISSTDGVLLQSPKNGYPCDAKSGPFVECFDIKECLGDARTFLVHFQATTYVNECEENQNFLGAILANRWHQRHELDQNYGLTIITEGDTYFRNDIVFKEKVNPDTLRPFMFLPIPLGYQRERIGVQMNTDATHCKWVTVDVEKSHQFVVGNEVGATQIEANFKQVLHSGDDFAESTISAIDGYYNLKWQANAANRETKEHSVEKPETSPFKPDPSKPRRPRGTP